MIAFHITTIAFGVWTLFRTLQHFSEQKILSEESLTKIGTAYLLFIFMVALCFSHLPTLFSTLIILPIILLAKSPSLFLRLRHKKFRQQMPNFLNAVILQMRSGKGFRDALRDSRSQISSDFDRQLEEILYCIFLSGKSTPQTHPFCLRVMNEFSQIERTPHLAMKRLINFRRMLRVEDEFRHKSGQAARQTRAQAFILGLLHLAMTVFSIMSFGFWSYAKIYAFSLLLAVLGGVILHIIGGRLRCQI